MAADFEATHSELSPAASEEVNALIAVFGDAARYSRNTATLAVCLDHSLVLRFKLSPLYPHDAPPVCTLEGGDNNNNTLTVDLQAKAANFLSQLWAERRGDVVLFDVVEAIRSQLEDLAAAASVRLPKEEAAAREAWRAHLERLAQRMVHTQQPVVVSKSTFVAHACACETTDDVEGFLELLLNNRRIATATHNIMAFRVETPAGGLLADCDDNGEAGAGRQLLQLLTATKARNVCVVVSRWFGGTLLGPDRFKIIVNCARELLVAHSFIADK